MPGQPLDLTGLRYGLLEVLDQAPATSGDTHTRWLCLCDCGEGHIARGSDLRRGRSTSCGCLGYRRNSLLHQHARLKVPARKRRRIARLGAAARLAPRGSPVSPLF